MKTVWILSITLFPYLNLFTQEIKSGFNVEEVLKILNLSAHQFDQKKWAKSEKLPDLPEGFELTYRAPETGLNNRWDLFTNGKVAVISIRGTVASLDSWLENFHAALIPAEGQIQLPDSTVFKYKFASHPKAMVHVGWTYGLGSMAPDIIEKILAYYQKGYRDFYLVGFSQGASIVQLLNSYLHYLPKQLPEDIRMKTFAFACPKTGNMFYSNDYSYINRGGWEFRITNVEDWVPRMPFTVQKIADMPENNPFIGINSVFKSMKPLQRMVLKSIYNKLNRKINAAAKRLRKTLGEMVGKFIQKRHPNLSINSYSESFDYYPAGTNIVISSAVMPDTLTSTQKIFFHHMPIMYMQRIQQDFGIDQ